MITALHVRIGWERPGRLPLLPPNDLTPDLADPRVLRAVYDGIKATPGVTGVDLVSRGNAASGGRPYFVVSVSDAELDGTLRPLRLGAAALHEGVIEFSLAWAQDGGIKVARMPVRLEIM